MVSKHSTKGLTNDTILFLPKSIYNLYLRILLKGFLFAYLTLQKLTAEICTVLKDRYNCRAFKFNFKNILIQKALLKGFLNIYT